MNCYDWIPFFSELCKEMNLIAANIATRENVLMQKAVATFDADHTIVKHHTIDPFSYIYALAQRNTAYQYTAYYTRAKIAFGLTANLPTDRIFPTPTPNTMSLFYSNGQYIDKVGNQVGNECLWNLFDQVFNNRTIVEDDFSKVLSLKNVAFTKLSQAFFLINPENFIPFDKQMNSLTLPELNDLGVIVVDISINGSKVYTDILKSLRSFFPGCKMYEINLLNVLLNGYDDNHITISNRYCQVSSYAQGDKDDYFDSFVKSNAVWTGGPSSGSGKTIYPLTEVSKGDIVLVRRGRVYLGGIGVVLENEYLEGGWEEHKSIKVIWLTKEDKRIPDGALAQWEGFDWATEKTIGKFRAAYSKTFDVLNQIRYKQKTMVNHSINKYKNLILHGPPGTGKTRLAKQIAEWLTSDLEKSLTLIQAIDQKVFTKEPNIEGNEQVSLVQFHPSYSYEDFVRGIKAGIDTKGNVKYEVENKVLARIVSDANKAGNQSKSYVLIIDEINRANLPSVLGELIYALEYRGKAVKTIYEYEGTNELIIPDNVYVIGTMNTADRSVGHIDYAIRRRFSFIQVLPDEKAISYPKAKELYKKVRALFDKFISPEFNSEDIMIGHSYFLFNDDEIAMKLKYDIKPILCEYVKDGILKTDAEPLINQLSV